MKRVSLQPAYVLHRRPYRETSFLVEIFTPEHGRLSLLARGVRKAKSMASGLLQPFTPLLISWAGRSELMTLTETEINGEVRRLQGDCMFAGFYLNELIMALLHKWDPHPTLFSAYDRAITALQTNPLQEKVLRSFEKCLLEELGYGVLPKTDSNTSVTFSADKFYRYIPEQGLTLSEIGAHDQIKANIFSGKHLLAISREDWGDSSTLQAAKRLTRYILAPLLGAKQLHSRRLFMGIDEEK